MHCCPISKLSVDQPWSFHTGCSSCSTDESCHFSACCSLRHLDVVVALISLLVAWLLTLSNRLTRHPSIPAFGAPPPSFAPFPLTSQPAHLFYSCSQDSSAPTCHSREIGNRWRQKGGNVFAGTAEEDIESRTLLWETIRLCYLEADLINYSSDSEGWCQINEIFNMM